MKPPDIPEQRPASIEGLNKTTQKFRETITKTMHQIAIDTYNSHIQPEKYHKTLDQAHEVYYRSMKGTTNTQQTDVNELIEAEIRRQQTLYKRIEDLSPYFENVEPLDPTELVEYPYWDHKPSHGVNIEINNTIFYAMPRVLCSTQEYVTLKQAPVPANVVYINEDMILMLPYREDPSDETRKQLNKHLSTSGQVTEDLFDDPIHVRKNFLWANSEKKIDEHDINRLMVKYGVDAFMVGYPSRNIALIYTGLEESIERLWKETYFSSEIWRRYGWY